MFYEFLSSDNKKFNTIIASIAISKLSNVRFNSKT